MKDVLPGIGGPEIVLLAILAVYFVPTMIALVRRRYRLIVFLLNFLVGWTVIAWIAALALACWPRRPDTIGSPTQAPISRP